MSHRAVYTLIILAFAAMSGVISSAEESRRPNVLFIMADDLNCNLGCYGDRLAVSPNIDRLATRAVRFDRAYCQYPVCNASRSSMLSGLRPDATGITDNATPLRTNLKDHIFLPQAFRKAGYRTVKFGKIFHAVLNSGDLFEDPASWDEDVREDESTKSPSEKLIDQKYSKLSAIRMNANDSDLWDGRIARQAVARLNELATQQQSFFLAVGFRRPHVPYISPRRYWNLFDPANLLGPVEPADHLKRIPRLALKKNDPAASGGVTDDEWRTIRQAYRASIAYMDAQVGLLLDTMDQRKLWDNTIVVFISDHGYHLGEHGGLWHKGTLFEEATRVPFLVAAPGAKAGSTARGLVELLDVYPTLTELCRIPAPSNLEGLSFAPRLKNPDLPGKAAALTIVVRGGQESSPKFLDSVADPAAFLEARREGNKEKKAESLFGRTIRTDRWRYTEWDNGRAGIELYDHVEDPKEHHNLANTKAEAETQNELRALLKAGGKENLATKDRSTAAQSTSH